LLLAGTAISRPNGEVSIGYSAPSLPGDSSSQRTNSTLKKDSFTQGTLYYQRVRDEVSVISPTHSLPNDQSIGRSAKEENEDWKFWLSLFLLAFLALIRFGYAKDFEEMSETFKNWGVNQQMIRELSLGVPFGVVLLNIFSSLVISFYVFLVVQNFNAVSVNPSWLLMFLSFAGVAVVLLFRLILLKTAEIIFPFRKELKLYSFYEIQIHRALGLCLFPLVILMAFSVPLVCTIALYASFVIVVIMWLIRYIKGFSIGISYFGAHVVHFLLYLCGLEIAPVLIIIRLLLNLGSIRMSL